MNHYSLFELNSLIKTTLSQELEPSYWVVAEIGELRVNQKGHCYLELLEKSGDETIAKVKATIWAYTYRNLSAWFESMTHQTLQAGMKVMLNVQVQFHEVFGLSFNVRDIDPTYTLGESEKRKAEVLNKLSKEGILDMNRELMLPHVPQNIAVISSPTAAGFEDFMDQLESNPERYLVNTRLYKAIMQGQEALHSIPDAMHRIHQKIENYDLLVIIRGGGSQLDLDCFDSYEISSHVAQFPIPVITGIGHERDETIVDKVAHTRMKTPTAAAEFILNGFREFESALMDYKQRIVTEAESAIENEKYMIDEFANSLRLLSRGLIQSNLTKLDFFEGQVKKLPFALVQKNQLKLDNFQSRLQLLDPKRVLKRGYTISTISGKLLKNIKKVNKGEVLLTQGYNTEIESEIIRQK